MALRRHHLARGGQALHQHGLAGGVEAGVGGVVAGARVCGLRLTDGLAFEAPAGGAHLVAVNQPPYERVLIVTARKADQKSGR